MYCHRPPVPEATKASRLPGLQSHPSPNWQESPHSLHSRPHTTQPVSVGSLRAGTRPRTHTTGHTSLSRTRLKSQLLENCKYLFFLQMGVLFLFTITFIDSYFYLYFATSFLNVHVEASVARCRYSQYPLAETTLIFFNLSTLVGMPSSGDATTMERHFITYLMVHVHNLYIVHWGKSVKVLAREF